ncbi:MAG: hypothetical protein DLM67_23965 [Candidatus Nephthysia bennettiae]|uniref:Uncharacterized protein n=1 Tax=Candidatus Nephthysia bennettiae TaxID=3127016 RepID=A0A934KCL3_9BACT|nr:hypothetical protein [Candidatus Dormibacteraeota bacterium]MBJ7614660.1 hypothetical protein [Candidatus Dormibacteraeota bacterium]PZR86472.1 MAG: hypothetical protein DLM67_23965 [Candidatus Dormibacteraeota bacterium]
MAEFGPESTIRRIIEDCPEGRRLLYDHGYDVGEGFVDVLSQYQNLRHAGRSGRLRNVEALVEALNGGCRPEAAEGGGEER